MVSGFWYNQDGLPIQYGTQKAVSDTAGDYLVYGETREIEQLIPLVPMQQGSGNTPLIAAPPTTFSGTGNFAAAGITSPNVLVPLQITAPITTTTGGNLVFNNTNIFLEEVTVETLIGATGGTSLAVGLVATSPGTPSSTFVQVTPNAGTQILNGLVIGRITTTGQRTTFTAPPAASGLQWELSTTVAAGTGAWMGNMPLVTNAITPLPNSAWISTIATGAFTNGLIKLRLRYTIYGNISF
jgi:hypothetical protein